MALEAVGIFEVAEDGFEGGVLEGGAVHVAGDPAVGERERRERRESERCEEGEGREREKGELVVKDRLSL